MTAVTVGTAFPRTRGTARPLRATGCPMPGYAKILASSNGAVVSSWS
jgi:hypothetical protein